MMLRSFRFSFALVSTLTFLAAAAPSRADVVLPTSAFSSGAGNPPAQFQTDVRVFNPGNSPVNVTPVFYNQGPDGGTVTKPFFTVPARSQVAFDNILQSLFGLSNSPPVFGPIRFQSSSPILVSSGTNNVNSCVGGVVTGQWIPGIDVGQALTSGTLVQLAASIDPGTGYRSNVVFMYPGTTSATVRAKLRKGDGTLLADVTLDPLGPNGFRQINRLDVFIGNPNTVTDTNLWLEFTSDQPVLSFASVINNASGDPFAVTATPEIPASILAPVASYTVSASPTAGQPVTFTDTSSNSPVNRFWAFGDGAFTAGGGTTAQHTYAASGTYKSALFVDNAGGSANATKDVTVSAPATRVHAVSATTTGGTLWTFRPNSVTCKVGVPCQITWSTPAAEANHHGLGGLAVLGITGCDDGGSLDNIIPTHPCTVTFTPTANMLNSPGPSYMYACTQSTCGNAFQHNGMTGVIVIEP